MDSANATLEAAKQLFGKAVVGLHNLTWDDIPEPARQYIAAHPKLTAIQLVMVLLAACPWLVATPLLGALGFGGLGPVAGSFAAAFQAVHGAIPAFGFLQGAAMGGAQAAAVNGVFQGAAAVGASVAEMFKWRNGTGGGA